MPWILLTEPTRAAVSLEREAWVVVGGLERSLCQAGMLDVLLRKGRRPWLIYTGGIATVNAMFSGRGRSSDLQSGWERLRAARFLASAALGTSGVAVFSTTPHTRALSALRGLLASAPASDGSAELLLLTATGLAQTPVGSNGAGLLTAPLSSELLSAEATPANLAAAISDACTRGATHVVVCAVDEAELAKDRKLRQAIASARSDGTEVSFLATASRSSLGLLHYLLPGLGGAERLTALGREAALLFVGNRGGLRR